MATDISVDGAGSAAGSQARILASISFAHLVSHLHILVLPPLFPFLKALLHVSYIDLGLALTAFGLVSGVTQAPVGALVDRYGARAILVGGLVLGSLSFIGLSLWLTYAGLIACGISAGLANSVYHPANYAILADKMDPARMGHAFSVHTFAGYVGGAIAPATMYFIAAHSSVSVALATAGVVGLAAAAFVAMTDVGSSKPRDLDGNQSASLRGIVTPALILLTAFFTLIGLSTGGINSFGIAALVTGYAVSASSATIALTVFLAASALGVLFGGRLADRTARHGDVAAVSFAANAVIMLLIAVAPLPTAIIICALGAAGFLTGIVAPSRDMMVRKAAPPGAMGRAFGFVSTGFNIGSIIGPLLFGWIMDQALPRWVFGISAVFMLITVALIVTTETSFLRRKAA